MGAVTFSLDPRLLTVLVDRVPFSTFVETGTFRGDSVAVAQGSVPTLISVESDASLAAAAMERFADDPDVRILNASGAESLLELAPTLAGQDVLYWLDAHWCATPEDPNPFGSQCELIDEIDAIGRLSAGSVVLIDDARLFLTSPPAPHDPAEWPSFHEVIDALTKSSPTHEVAVVNDVIAFVPPDVAPVLRTFAAQCGVDWLTMAEKARGYDILLADNIAKERVIAELAASALAGPPAPESVVEPELVLEPEPEPEPEPVPAVVALSWRLARLRMVRPSDVATIRSASGHRARHTAHRVLTRPFALAQYEPRPPGLRLGLEQAPPAPRPASLPGIALAMPSFNQARYLESSMRSVLLQRYPGLQFVVQDGGSSDGSVSVIERYHDRLRAAASEPDHGQADAINRAFARTDAEIMGWLNSDDLLMPGALQEIGSFFARRPDVDVVYASRLVIDHADLEIGRWIVPPTTHEFLDWADYIPQETLYWRRSLWERVGGQLDASRRFALDWDLLLRFVDAGATFARIPRVLGAFRVHEQSKTVGAIEDVGAAEMGDIRRMRHGRDVSHHEISSALRPLYVQAWRERSRAR